MGDYLLAWRNIWRNPRRSVLTILAIIFASGLLVFMLSFQFGAYEDMIDSSVRLSTGHLQIQPVGYQNRPEMHKVIENPGPLLERVAALDGVDAATVRSETFALAAGAKRSRGTTVSGVRPEVERRISTLPGQIRKGRYLQDGDKDVAVIGALGAERLQIDIGDECTLIGQGRDGSVAATVVRIVGVFQTGIDEFDRASIHIPLKTFQEIYSMQGAVHEVVVIADSLRDIDKIKHTIKADLLALNLKKPLTVLDWNELMPGLRQSIEMDLISGLIFYLLLLLVVAFSILNTFLMAIFERTREFGVMMAIGITPGRLTKVLLIESMSMTLVGIVAGIVVGCLITVYFQSHGIDFSGASELLSQFGITGRMYPKLSLLSAVSGPLAVLIITFFTALYPALKVRRMRPVEAMRAV